MKSISSPTLDEMVESDPSGWNLKHFDYHSPTRVIYGPNSLMQLGEVAKELGGTRVLLVTDSGLEKAGHPQRAIATLEQAGLRVFLFDKVEENPSSKHVNFGVEFTRPLNVDLIVAVGGGSSMDCAKGINFLLTNGGTMSDYKGFGRATKPMLPSIGVPTTAGTGSEAQSYALIADESTHMKMACGDRKAAFHVAILDPVLTISQPPMVTALTGLDALAHALESFVCRKRNVMSQMYARQAWQLLEPNLEIVLRSPENLAARSAMQLGAFLAGLAIENSMLGVCHSCANPLTAHYGIVHGQAIGIMMPHVLRYNAEVVGELYADLASTMDSAPGDSDDAAEVISQRILELMQLAGLPTRLSDCQVSTGILHLLAEEASQQWTAQFNPRSVSEQDILVLLQSAH